MKRKADPLGAAFFFIEPAPFAVKKLSKKASSTRKKATRPGEGAALRGRHIAYRLKAITMRGLEDVLAREIQELGGQQVQPGRAVVTFRGDLSLLYRSCLYLHSAIRVLLELGSTRIADQGDLYTFGRSLPWTDWFSPRNTIAVESAVYSRIFSNSHFAALKLKDAVCDEFKARIGNRPDVAVRNPDINIHLHIHEQDCSISLDAAGGALHRRGYRTETDQAPLSEVLAAGMIQIASPDWSLPFYDFMCGSGTIPIEAFMIREGLAPNLLRSMAFEKWTIYSKQEHEKWLSQAKSEWSRACTAQKGERKENRSQKADRPMVRGSDQSSRAIDVAKSNGKNLNLTSQQVLFETGKAEQISNLEPEGTAIINPPYGERLSLDDAARYYKELGNILKHSFKGWTVWILSSNKEGLKSIGLKASRKVTLFNGPLECSFRRYDIY